MLKTLILVFFVSISIHSQEKKYYFLNPENNFGSDKLFNPLSLLVNGSFDILRNGGHDKHIFKASYYPGYKNLFKSLGRPIGCIRDYGWKTFLKQEVFNLDLNKDNANFLPNFADHTIGNGMQYAKLAEWFDYYNYPLPELSSFIVTTIYQLNNECIENGMYDGPNIDAIADVYIFNTLGFVLFEFDAVKKFFSETLPVYEWSLQPMYNFTSGHLENAGQQYLVRKKLPYINNFSAFIYWGLTGIAGLSYSQNGKDNFSIGAGQITNKIRENLSGRLRYFSPDLDGAVVFFYDRNNSLLLSALYTGPKIPNFRLNVYPGLFKLGFLEPGIFIGAGKWDNFVIGINLTHYLPVSASFGNAER